MLTYTLIRYYEFFCDILESIFSFSLNIFKNMPIGPTNYTWAPGLVVGISVDKIQLDKDGSQKN